MFFEGFTKIRYESGIVDYWRLNRPQIKFFNNHYSRIKKTDDPFGCVVIRHDPKTINLKSRQYGLTTIIIADIVHDWCFRPGYHVKIVAYKAKTAEKMKWIADTLYQGTIDTFKMLGRDPYRFIPYADTDHATMLKSETTGSTIEFLTFEGKGTGQGETVNRIYGTEIALWRNWSDHWPGLVGTAVKDGSFVSDLDFNARGTGNPSHKRYIKAKLGESDYIANFSGIDDYDYPAGFLADQRRELGPRAFKEQYPRNDVEAFQKNDSAIFDPEMIERNRRAEYYHDEHGTDPSTRFHVIGVDPAEGIPDGDNTSITVFDAETMHEACPPDIGKFNPRETAHRIKNKLAKYPGVFNVLRLNHGHAVHEVLTDIGIMRHSFVDPDDGKPGYPESSRGRITIMETELDCMLDADEIKLVDDVGIDELKIYQKNDNGKTGAPTTTDDDDGGRYFDDTARSIMAAVIARDFARRRARASRNATATIAESNVV